MAAPPYLSERDADAYGPFWADRKLRRLVLITGLPLPFVGFPFGLFCFLVLTWYAGGHRCPRCKHRFARGRFSLLFRKSCANCELLVNSRRDLTEPPMFPLSTIPAIRRFRPTEWRAYRELRLASLADAPDAFGSTLEQERGRSDKEWSTRLGANPDSNCPVLAEIGGVRVGLAWGRIDPESPDTAHVYQMWVAPDQRQRAIGRMLLDAIIDWARRANLRQLLLSVTCGETPAARLYSQAGFVNAGDPVPVRPGSPLFAQPMKLELLGHTAPTDSSK